MYWVRTFLSQSFELLTPALQKPNLPSEPERFIKLDHLRLSMQLAAIVSAGSP